jgi:hypothetical protein
VVALQCRVLHYGRRVRLAACQEGRRSSPALSGVELRGQDPVRRLFLMFFASLRTLYIRSVIPIRIQLPRRRFWPYRSGPVWTFTAS